MNATDPAAVYISMITHYKHTNGIQRKRIPYWKALYSSSFIRSGNSMALATKGGTRGGGEQYQSYWYPVPRKWLAKRGRGGKNTIGTNFGKLVSWVI